MSHIAANVDRFMGFADVYNRHRPVPPPAIVDLLVQLAATPRPALVADIGSGTGLSTMIWAGRADQVIGVEPGADMRYQAEETARDLPLSHQVSFREGTAAETGLADGTADIVTISQALHWMEPDSTFPEVARILRPGGIFAAYDCDWPPAVNAEVERAFNTLMSRVRALETLHGTSRGVYHWAKELHLDRMRDSRRFSYTREIVLHHIEQGDAERLVGLAVSQGGLASLLKAGLNEDEIGITAMREAAHRALGESTVPFWWSYRVRMGVR